MYVLRKKDVPLTKKIDKENLFVRDLSTSKVLSVENIILNMTSKELLTLNSILHIANIRKNLMSGSLLSKNGFKKVFKSEKSIFVMTSLE
jgi:hypothetical protein